MNTILNLNNFLHSFKIEELKTKKAFKFTEEEHAYLNSMFAKLELKTDSKESKIVYINESNLSSKNMNIIYIECDEEGYIKEVKTLPNTESIRVSQITFNKNKDNDIYWHFTDFSTYDKVIDGSIKVEEFITKNNVLINRILTSLSVFEDLISEQENLYASEEENGFDYSEGFKEKNEELSQKIKKQEEIVNSIFEEYKEKEEYFLKENKFKLSEKELEEVIKSLKGIKKSGSFNKYYLLNNNYKFLNKNELYKTHSGNVREVFAKEVLHETRTPLIIEVIDGKITKKNFKTSEVEALCEYNKKGFIKTKKRTDKTGNPSIAKWQPSETIYDEEGNVIEEKWEIFDKETKEIINVIDKIESFKKEHSLSSLNNLNKKENIALNFKLNLINEKVLNWANDNDVDLDNLLPIEQEMLENQFGF